MHARRHNTAIQGQYVMSGMEALIKRVNFDIELIVCHDIRESAMEITDTG